MGARTIFVLKFEQIPKRIERWARLQNTPQLKLFGAATENGYAVGASTRYSKGLGMSYLYSADKSSNYFKVF